MSEVTRDIVIACMRLALKRIRSERAYFSSLMQETINELADKGLLEGGRVAWNNEIAQSYLGTLLVEAYIYLQTMGLIVPDFDNNAFLWAWLRLTDAGKQWIQQQEPIPEDQQGYLAALNKLVPTLDEVVRQYIQESIIAYDRRAFFAAAVMLGAACEKLAYMILEALQNAITEPNRRGAIRNALQERSLPRMFHLIQDGIELAKQNGMPYEVYEGTDAHLLSLQESIRVQRNDAVHPIAGQVTPEAVRLCLFGFPWICKKIYDLITWIIDNRPLQP